jgi:hypothetical protein
LNDGFALVLRRRDRVAPELRAASALCRRNALHLCRSDSVLNWYRFQKFRRIPEVGRRWPQRAGQFLVKGSVKRAVMRMKKVGGLGGIAA